MQFTLFKCVGYVNKQRNTHFLSLETVQRNSVQSQTMGDQIQGISSESLVKITYNLGMEKKKDKIKRKCKSLMVIGAEILVSSLASWLSILIQKTGGKFLSI